MIAILFLAPAVLTLIAIGLVLMALPRIWSQLEAPIEPDPALDAHAWAHQLEAELDYRPAPKARRPGLAPLPMPQPKAVARPRRLANHTPRRSPSWHPLLASITNSTTRTWRTPHLV